MNEKLSEHRAGAVRDSLAQQGAGGKLSQRGRLWRSFAVGLQQSLHQPPAKPEGGTGCVRRCNSQSSQCDFRKLALDVTI